jgi:hypothetical protein
MYEPHVQALYQRNSNICPLIGIGSLELHISLLLTMTRITSNKPGSLLPWLGLKEWRQIHQLYFFFYGSTALYGPGPPRFVKVSWPHTLDTPQSVGLLWTRDQLVAETSTWQHTTVTKDRHPCPRWDFFFFACPGFFPFDPFLYCFKSFRPSCHFLRSILPSFQKTQHKHPCPPWDFFLSVRGFSPLIHFCTV